VADEYLTYAAKPKENAGFAMKRADERGHGVIAEDRAVFLAEILSGKKHGRTSRRQITYSERGNIQGAQFFAVAGKGYEVGRGKGGGREISTPGVVQGILDFKTNPRSWSKRGRKNKNNYKGKFIPPFFYKTQI